jgi:IS66 C-terminal element
VGLPLSTSRTVANTSKPTLMRRGSLNGYDGGAQWNAVVVSLIASCRIHDVEPWAYLRDVLTILPAWSAHRAIELAPAHWQKTREQPETRQLLDSRKLLGRVVGHANDDAAKRSAGSNAVE